MTKANVARGEVDLSLDGIDYVLDGSFENLARLQGSLNVIGLAPAVQMIIGMDPRALMEGVKALAISGDVTKLGKMNFGRHAATVQTALVRTLEGMREDDKPGNAGGAASQSQS